MCRVGSLSGIRIALRLAKMNWFLKSHWLKIQAAVQQAVNGGQNVLIASGTRGVFLYALTSNELQAVIDEPLRSRFDFVFDASRCGAIQVTTASATNTGTDTTLITPVTITTSAEMADNPYTLYVVQRRRYAVQDCDAL